MGELNYVCTVKETGQVFEFATWQGLPTWAAMLIGAFVCFAVLAGIGISVLRKGEK